MRKRDEWRLSLRLAAEHDSATGDCRGALGGSDYGSGRRRGGPLLFSDGGGVDFSVGSHGERGDFALGGFIENETFGGGRIFGSRSAWSWWDRDLALAQGGLGFAL